MNENLNLVEILKGCPKGTKLYSSVYGEVRFERINNYDAYPIEIKVLNKFTNPSVISAYLVKDGRCISTYDGECTLFPAKDQRDWLKFKRFWDKPKVERFDAKTLQPFARVLVKDGLSSEWACTFFSHMANDVSFPVYCSGGCFKVCIPYNIETKHLVGTKKDCPDYYKWWEEEL